MLILIVIFTAIGLGLLIPWIVASMITFFEVMDGRNSPLSVDTWMFLWLWFMCGATSLGLAGACWYYW